MPNKTLTVNLDPKIEAKLSGFFDGLTANLRIATEEYERVLCLFHQANKAKREARRELKAEKQWRQETTVPFLEWGQSYLYGGRWAGHDMFDAVKTELLERDEDARQMAQALKDIADYLPSEELRYQLLQETASSAERSNKKMKWNLMITAQRAFEKHGAKYLEPKP